MAPLLLLLAALGAIWTVDYKQRVAEQGGVFRGEAIQVARSLRLAVERSIGSLDDLLSMGDIAGMLEAEENRQIDLSSEAWKARMRQIDELWSSLRLDSPQVQAVVNNVLAGRLRSFGRKNWIFAEIIIADAAGSYSRRPRGQTTTISQMTLVGGGDALKPRSSRPGGF